MNDYPEESRVHRLRRAASARLRWEFSPSTTHAFVLAVQIAARDFKVSPAIKIHLRRACLLLCLLPLASCHRNAPANYTGPGAPPPGLYRCWSGGFAHLPAGTLTLTPTGHYESYRPHGGGDYAFTLSTSTIEFLNGDYNYWEYRGLFQPAPQSPDHRDRIVLMPLGAKATIGTERPGEYQYCYGDPSPGFKHTAP